MIKIDIGPCQGYFVLSVHGDMDHFQAQCQFDRNVCKEAAGLGAKNEGINSPERLGQYVQWVSPDGTNVGKVG